MATSLFPAYNPAKDSRRANIEKQVQSGKDVLSSHSETMAPGDSIQITFTDDDGGHAFAEWINAHPEFGFHAYATYIGGNPRGDLYTEKIITVKRRDPDSECKELVTALRWMLLNASIRIQANDAFQSQILSKLEAYIPSDLGLVVSMTDEKKSATGAHADIIILTPKAANENPYSSCYSSSDTFDILRKWNCTMTTSRLAPKDWQNPRYLAELERRRSAHRAPVPVPTPIPTAGPSPPGGPAIDAPPETEKPKKTETKSKREVKDEAKEEDILSQVMAGLDRVPDPVDPYVEATEDLVRACSPTVMVKAYYQPKDLRQTQILWRIYNQLRTEFVGLNIRLKWEFSSKGLVYRLQSTTGTLTSCTEEQKMSDMIATLKHNLVATGQRYLREAPPSTKKINALVFNILYMQGGELWQRRQEVCARLTLEACGSVSKPIQWIPFVEIHPCRLGGESESVDVVCAVPFAASTVPSAEHPCPFEITVKHLSV